MLMEALNGVHSLWRERLWRVFEESVHNKGLAEGVVVFVPPVFVLSRFRMASMRRTRPGAAW
jgi:hypothetical protein